MVEVIGNNTSDAGIRQDKSDVRPIEDEPAQLDEIDKFALLIDSRIDGGKWRPWTQHNGPTSAIIKAHLNSCEPNPIWRRVGPQKPMKLNSNPLNLVDPQKTHQHLHLHPVDAVWAPTVRESTHISHLDLVGPFEIKVGES